jgi:type II secretory pathway pseudopilin PulG
MHVSSIARDSRGFSLLEVLVSSGLLIVIAAGVSQIVSVAVKAAHASRARTTRTTLGVQKMEQLRSLVWSDDDGGTPGAASPSDFSTDISTDPSADGGRGLALSPGGTLDANVPPYVDHMTEEGAWAGNGSSPGAAAVYTRRWAVRPLPGDPANTVILHVVVLRAGTVTAEPDDLRLVSARTRRH